LTEGRSISTQRGLPNHYTTQIVWEEWVDAFMPYEIALMPDGDGGGTTFCQQIRKLFRARGKSTLIITLPKGKDVAEVAAYIDSKRRRA
jgi:hypothetical protein